MKNNYEESLRLAKKREANSNLKAWSSDVFYISDPELIKEITEKGKEAVKKYKELFGDSNECYVTKDALDKFNEMLHDGKHTREECYNYLVKEKNKLEYKFYQDHGFPISLDFMFLYPERISNFDLENFFKHK